jgi:lipopolysaccharide transport system ATP-binding protein
MNAIEVNHLTKIYRLYHSPKDRLIELVSLSHRKYHREFHALHDVSFTVENGQTIGIIGMNGSGKSTVLKIICNVIQPTSGSFSTTGRISAILNLGAGFNPEFTGRENVYMNGALMGFSREEMDKRYTDIEKFADIGEFIDQPVKIYSNGMYMRLAFAAAVSVAPDILVVDEALSVGDMFFRHKCIARMEAFQKEGKTVLIVAHDMNLLKNWCSRVLLLHEGKIVDYGDPEYVTEHYMMLVRQKQAQYANKVFRVEPKSPADGQEAKTGFGTKAGSILDVSVMDIKFTRTAAFLAGDQIVICIHACVDAQVKNPNIAFMLRDQRGYNIYGVDTAGFGLELQKDENGRMRVFFSFSPVLAPGSYSLVIRLEEYSISNDYLLIDKQVGVGSFQVIENGNNFLGAVNLYAQAFQDVNKFVKQPVQNLVQ